MTSKIRSNQDPSWCSDATNKFAEWFPLQSSGRQASFYDPKTKQFTLIDTCYSHAPPAVRQRRRRDGVLQRADRSDLRLDRHQGLRPDARRAEGRRLVRSGARHQRRRQDHEAVECARRPRRFGALPGRHDRRRAAGARGARRAGAVRSQARHDGQLQPVRGDPEPGRRHASGASASSYPGFLVRLQRGNNPPSSCKTQIFKVPEPGFDPRGVDIDSNGVVWTALAASSHLASFDVRKCKDLNGPAKIDGSQCREGWTLYQTTGPKLKGTDIPADFHYYNWVDQHNISGFGAEHAVRHRLELRFAAGAEPADQRVDDAARAVSARVLLARHGRPHRRCRTPDGRAARSTRTTARTSSGTSRAERAPRARSSSSRSGPNPLAR